MPNIDKPSGVYCTHPDAVVYCPACRLHQPMAEYAAKRIAELEAENGRLRERVSELSLCLRRIACTEDSKYCERYAVDSWCNGCPVKDTCCNWSWEKVYRLLENTPADPSRGCEAATTGRVASTGAEGEGK